MKELFCALLVFSVLSNIWLWINFWNLKCRHFEFEEITLSSIRDLLTVLCKHPAEDRSGQSAEQPADKV